MFMMANIWPYISIHAPARGATEKSVDYIQPYSISIHAPARGATYHIDVSVEDVKISIHAPARGATYLEVPKMEQLAVFQSTLPRGERLARKRHRGCLKYFNPRSREGSDPE